MPDRLEKPHLLAHLAAEVCPICHGRKEPQRWTCYPCMEPHRRAPEAKALNNACDAHLEAARTFLEMVQAYQQRPESD
jgi:hypothetical protein